MSERRGSAWRPPTSGALAVAGPSVGRRRRGLELEQLGRLTQLTAHIFRHILVSAGGAEPRTAPTALAATATTAAAAPAASVVHRDDSGHNVVRYTRFFDWLTR